MPQDSHILSRIADTNSTIILAESDIQLPVKSILDVPVIAHSIKVLFGIAGQVRDVVPCFCLTPLADSSFCTYHADCLQSRPLLGLYSAARYSG